MYRPPAYAIDDVATLHAAIRARRFGTLAAIVNGAVTFAYAPVALYQDPAPFGRIRFHLARANPLASLGGHRWACSFLGPDAYVSPDWYETAGLVPTWNYIAVEASGIAEELSQDDMRRLLVDLSAAAENALIPKRPWTIDKMPEERLQTLMLAIRGFELVLDRIEGKFKLSQDKNDQDLLGVAKGLESQSDGPSRKVAQAMRSTRTIT